MKRRFCLLLALLLLFGSTGTTGVRAAETVLAENLTDAASVLLFEPYGNTEIFAYNDGQTHILKTDGSAACTTTTPASAVYLCGSTVTAICSAAHSAVIERFDADSLTCCARFGTTFRESDILSFGVDRFGYSYAVLYSALESLQILNDTGSLEKTISFPVNILSVQILEDKLYIFLPGQCFSAPLNGTAPDHCTEDFSYTGSEIPFRMLTDTVYITTDGALCSTAGAKMNCPGASLCSGLTLAFRNSCLFWADSRAAVSRYDLTSHTQASAALPMPAAAITHTAAVLCSGNRYLRVPIDDFHPVSAPSPSASPAPTPGGAENKVCLYIPAGMTAAALLDSFSDTEAEIVTGSLTAATGKVRTGWVLLTPEAEYLLIVPGDLNGSGTVNRLDLRLLQQYLLGAQMPDTAQLLAADLNGSGAPDAADSVLLARSVE